MAVGSFLSEESAEEYEAKSEVSDGGPITGSVIMFVSFVLASFIPIVPYLVFNLTVALWVSIGLSIIALGIVGIVSARIVKLKVTSHAVKMMLLGGAAIVIGVLVGKFIKTG